MIDKAVRNPADCTGCSACAAVCPSRSISMRPDAEGFLYPAVDAETCVSCALCVKICPSLHPAPPSGLPSAFAFVHANEEIRTQSASGGAFSRLAESVLGSRGGGTVFGAAFDEDFRVAHRSVKRAEDLCLLRGSKYVQSRIGDTYREARACLESGGHVLFSGTPCQIAGLRAYLGREYERLLCADLICHGVPSPRLWEKYRAHREALAGAKTKQVLFRAKDEGWRLFSLSMTFENGARYRATFRDDPYLRVFLKNICLRPSCHACKYRSVGRRSDLTIADFWGIERVFPDLDDDRGTSLILVHSAKGLSALESAGAGMALRRADAEKAVRYNPAALRDTVPNKRRSAFFEATDALGFDELAQTFCADGVFKHAALSVHDRISASHRARALYDRLLKRFRK